MVYAAQAAIQHTTCPWCALQQAAMMFNCKLRWVHATHAAMWYCISFFCAPARRLDCRGKLSLFIPNTPTWYLRHVIGQTDFPEKDAILAPVHYIILWHKNVIDCNASVRLLTVGRRHIGIRDNYA